MLTYLCTFRSLSSPSSTCAPCFAFGQRLTRDNNFATHARLSRFSTLALRLIISLFQTRSAPRSRLSRLLPFALWQVTSLQAKSSVKDVQPSTTSVVLFSLSGCACVAHVLRVRSAPCPRLSRLLPFEFGKSPLCKQKSSVQDVQQKHGDLPCSYFLSVYLFSCVFGAGDKLLFLCARDEIDAKRYGKRNEFRSRGCQPKPRHLPQI